MQIAGLYLFTVWDKDNLTACIAIRDGEPLADYLADRNSVFMTRQLK